MKARRQQDLNIEDDWEFQFLGLRNRPRVIGLTGPTKSGKSIAAKRLATEYGFYFISLGGFLQETTRQLGKDPAKWHDLGQTATYLRMLKGQDILARMAFGQIRRQTPRHNVFVLDSLLHPAEIRFFAQTCDFAAIGIVADRDVRVENFLRWFGGEESDARDFIKLRDDFEQYGRQRRDQYSPNVDRCLSLIRDPAWKIQLPHGMTADTIHAPVDALIKVLAERWNLL